MRIVTFKLLASAYKKLTSFYCVAQFFTIKSRNIITVSYNATPFAQ